jgi:PAS domain S-box-containing protein
MTHEADATILLVDDDLPKRYTISKTLARAGFRVTEASTGSEALRLIVTQPDLVILDVKLPDINGFDVCRRIKSDSATRAIPVLHISTTFVDIEDKIHGLDSGADGYLTNVAEPLELLATVRALLRARRAEDAVELSTRQWQSTFDAISDGVMLLDVAGRVAQANRTLERILARPWTEIVGQSFADFLADSDSSDGSLFARMLVSGSRESRDFSFGDGWLQVTVDPLRDHTGSIKGAIGLVSDITDRKRMEVQLLTQSERLQQDSQRKDEFLAMLAHELRNPLAPLANTMEIIRLQVRGNRDIEESLDVARRQIKHMARLLEDLFDISRITRGAVELRISEVDLNAIVRQAVEAATPLVTAARHDLAVNLEAEPVYVAGDPTRLEQVVSNLLNNATKYTEPGGRIRLELYRQNGSAVLSVSDSGIGITPAMQRQIFDLFVQADQSLDRSRGGLGIGLTLVKRLVELHHGSISVHSEGLGRGSKFTVMIPALVRPTVAASVDASERERLVDTGSRVLIVDDNRDSARTLARVLEMDGHQVFCGFEGLGVVEQVAEHEPDVVLLDIGLPGIDGFQVAERLRERYPGERLRLVAVTGYGGQISQARALEAGFDHFLVKPVNLSDLKRLLAGRREP